MAEWRNFSAKQKAKRKGKQGNEADGVEEIVVQRMSADVCGKQQKYTRIGAQEYVPLGATPGGVLPPHMCGGVPPMLSNPDPVYDKKWVF